jgi:hypothetical protein
MRAVPRLSGIRSKWSKKVSASLDDTGGYERSAVGAPAVPYKASLQKSLVEPAGEHHCLAQLLLRGYLATSAPPRAPEVDLLVLSPDG